MSSPQRQARQPRAARLHPAVLGAALAALPLASCPALERSDGSTGPSPSGLASASLAPHDAGAGDLLTEPAAVRHLGELLSRRFGTSIDALSVLFYSDHAVLQLRSPEDTQRVDQYIYRGGALGAPRRVTLMGTGQLDDNVFPLALDQLHPPTEAVTGAPALAHVPEGRVTRVLLSRDLPRSMKVRFRVFVSSERRNGHIDVDAEGSTLGVGVVRTRPP